MISDYLKHFIALSLAGCMASLTLLHPRPVKAGAPDLGRLSISDLAAVTRDGSFGDISWGAGTSASEILRLGFFANTKLPNMSMGSILGAIGLSPGRVSLIAAPWVQKLSLRDLVRTIPGLGSTRLNRVAPFKDLIARSFGTHTAGNLSNQTLSSIVGNARFGRLTLERLPGLDNYSLASIPGLTGLRLNRFGNWRNLVILDIPGLDRLPFKNYLKDFTNVNLPLAMADVVFSDREAHRTNTITGSYNEGFRVPCDQSHCAHIELADLPGWPPLMKGKQWISGDSQSVSGGSGCLAGTEPTGRHPFGHGFKVVLNDTDERAGRAGFSLYFRFSLFCGTSPYIIGPFPFYSVKKKDTVIVGF
ncbi:MAG: hypothetical protein N5P05_002706 [Chroococcopsis gigantea SAG 12.99]|jgi:hypothetical protein|nr:hypothetical protein [Chlorogloea purpurea SAG 13.99]MDV3001100.1 hypothetical protein [Chroococcopsis gigantea SAG 12.99]